MTGIACLGSEFSSTKNPSHKHFAWICREFQHMQSIPSIDCTIAGHPDFGTNMKAKLTTFPIMSFGPNE